MKSKRQKSKRKIARRRDRWNKNRYEKIVKLSTKRSYVLFSDSGQVYFTNKTKSRITTMSSYAEVYSPSWQINVLVYEDIEDAKKLTKYKDWRAILIKSNK